MITIERDEHDPKRRLVLRVGSNQWHLSDKEARALRARLNRFKLGR